MLKQVEFIFQDGVPMNEVAETLRLAQIAVESLHGTERAKLEMRAEVTQGTRTCVIDTSTKTGKSLAVIFFGYARREFGNAAIRLQRDTATAACGDRAIIGDVDGCNGAAACRGEGGAK